MEVIITGNGRLWLLIAPLLVLCGMLMGLYLKRCPTPPRATQRNIDTFPQIVRKEKRA